MNADVRNQTRLRGSRLRALAAFAAPVAIAILPAGAQAALITPHAATPQQVTPQQVATQAAEPPAPAPASTPAPAVSEGDSQSLTTKSQSTPSQPSSRPPEETDQERYDRGVHQKAKAEQDVEDARQERVEGEDYDRAIKAFDQARKADADLTVEIEEVIEQVEAVIRSVFSPILGTEPSDDGMAPTSRDQSSITDNTSQPDGDSSSEPAGSYDDGGGSGSHYRLDVEDEGLRVG
jgi:hypothetical protein